MPEPKPKKERKPRQPRQEKKPDGPLVLSLKVEPLTAEQVAENKRTIAEMEERLNREWKQLAALKAEAKRPIKVRHVVPIIKMREDGIPILTEPDGKDIPLSSLSNSQVARVYEVAREQSK